jgi:hypothetical protein
VRGTGLAHVLNNKSIMGYIAAIFRDSRYLNGLCKFMGIYGLTKDLWTLWVYGALWGARVMSSLTRYYWGMTGSSLGLKASCGLCLGLIKIFRI